MMEERLLLSYDGTVGQLSSFFFFVNHLKSLCVLNNVKNKTMSLNDDYCPVYNVLQIANWFLLLQS